MSPQSYPAALKSPTIKIIYFVTSNLSHGRFQIGVEHTWTKRGRKVAAGNQKISVFSVSSYAYFQPNALRNCLKIVSSLASDATVDGKMTATSRMTVTIILSVSFMYSLTEKKEAQEISTEALE